MMNLSMNFPQAKPTTAVDWMWRSVFYRGTSATVIGYDADSFAVPMLRCLFSDGRIATLKISELGA